MSLDYTVVRLTVRGCYLDNPGLEAGCLTAELGVQVGSGLVGPGCQTSPLPVLSTGITSLSLVELQRDSALIGREL